MHWPVLLLLLAGLALGVLIVLRLEALASTARAHLLGILAVDAAAVVVNLMPNASWQELLQAIIQRVAGASTCPTRNTQVVSDACIAALVRFGRLAPTRPKSPPK